MKTLTSGERVLEGLFVGNGSMELFCTISKVGFCCCTYEMQLTHRAQKECTNYLLCYIIYKFHPLRFLTVVLTESF